MTMIIINEKSYAPVGTEPRMPVIRLEVEAVLDPAPGAWAQPEDLMNWIAQHSYVRQVRLVTEDDQ